MPVERLKYSNPYSSMEASPRRSGFPRGALSHMPNRWESHRVAYCHLQQRPPRWSKKPSMIASTSSVQNSSRVALRGLQQNISNELREELKFSACQCSPPTPTTAPPLHHGCTATTLNAATAHSEAAHPSADCNQPDVRAHLGPTFESAPESEPDRLPPTDRSDPPSTEAPPPH